MLNAHFLGGPMPHFMERVYGHYAHRRTTVGPSFDERTVLDMYMRELERYPCLTHQEHCQLARRARAGDRSARDRFILANLRLVIYRARSFQGRGLSFPELIQAGNLGLIKAVDHYDPERGTRFSTYALDIIRQEIFKAVCETSELVALPVEQAKLRNRMSWHQKRFYHARGYWPNDAELAKFMRIPIQHVKLLRRFLHCPISLDALQFITNGERFSPGETLLNILIDETAAGVSPELIGSIDLALTHSLRQLGTYLARLAHHSVRWAELMIKRHGLDRSAEPRMLREAAAALGLKSRQRAQQIEVKAANILFFGRATTDERLAVFPEQADQLAELLYLTEQRCRFVVNQHQVTVFLRSSNGDRRRWIYPVKPRTAEPASSSLSLATASA